MFGGRRRGSRGGGRVGRIFNFGNRVGPPPDELEGQILEEALHLIQGGSRDDNDPTPILLGRPSGEGRSRDHYYDDDDDGGGGGDDDGSGRLILKIGTAKSKIEGIENYEGRHNIEVNQLVTIHREQSDGIIERNLKVLNTSGQIIGYLPRGESEIYWELLERKQVERLDGIIPRGKGNRISIPLDLYLYGKRVFKDPIIEFLNRKKITFIVSDDSDDQLGVRHEMDDLFKESLRLQEKGNLMQASTAIKTNLYPHQMIALNWMFERENGKMLPPFWIEKNGHYQNMLSSMTTTRKPKCISGGILADDMGLGKTLTVISLIMTNFHDGKPMERPRFGFVRKPVQKSVRRTAPVEESYADYIKKSNVGEMVRKVEEERVKEETKGMNAKQKRDHLLKSIFSLCDSDHEKSDNEYGDSDPEDYAGPSTLKEQELKRLINDDQDSEIDQPIKKKKQMIIEDSDDEMNSENDPNPANINKNSDSMIISNCLQSNVKDNHSGQMSDNDKNKYADPSKVSIDELLASDQDSDSEQTSTHPKLNQPNQELKDGSGTQHIPNEIVNQPKLKILKCVCTKLSNRGFIISCNTCESRLHGRCVNINKKKMESIETFNCPFCVAKNASLLPIIYKVNSNLNVDGGTELSDDDNLDNIEIPDGDGDGDDDDDDQDNLLTVPSTSNGTSVQRLITPPSEPGLALDRPSQTLVVCPMALLQHWYDQIDEHVDRSVNIKVFIHHAQNKAKTLDELEEIDIVITTYGTISSEYRERDMGNEDKVILLSNHWLRVILDEGHLVKNPRTRMTKGVNELVTDRKWILTGTPIQNNLTELYSLVHWLNVEPFSDRKIFREMIDRQKGTTEGKRRLQLLLSNICLRRMKSDKINGKSIVELPPKTIELKEVHLEDKERNMYQRLEREGIEVIEDLIRKNKLMKNYAHVFALLMRLRQFCCHPELLPKDIQEKLNRALENIDEAPEININNDLLQMNESGLSENTKDELIQILRNFIKDGVDESCAVCLETLNFEESLITPCKHVYCEGCIEDLFHDDANETLCPLCRSVIVKNRLAKLPVNIENEVTGGEEADLNDIYTDKKSAKLESMFQELAKVPENEKVVIVSQFTSYLNILQPIMKKHKYKFTRFDGTMNTAKRNAVLEQFKRDTDIRILLLSLKAGGVGLNLVMANHLYLLDPAWNPATEDQCFDRVYRLGQEKPVTIKKFIVNETIEDRILDLQAKKKELAAGAFSRNISRADARANRIRDIQVLINLPSRRN